MVQEVVSLDLDILWERTVDEIIRRHPAAMPALHRLGIDLCCGGWLTLRRAAEQAGVAPEALRAALAAAGLAGGGRDA